MKAIEKRGIDPSLRGSPGIALRVGAWSGNGDSSGRPLEQCCRGRGSNCEEAGNMLMV